MVLGEALDRSEPLFYPVLLDNFSASRRGRLSSTRYVTTTRFFLGRPDPTSTSGCPVLAPLACYYDDPNRGHSLWTSCASTHSARFPEAGRRAMVFNGIRGKLFFDEHGCPKRVA